MPKRKRSAHAPQGAPRKRRPVRRPEFQPEPPPSNDDEEAPPPTFADEPVMQIPVYGVTGPVETRPHWIQQEERRQGRRMQQLKRGTRDLAPATRIAAAGSVHGFDTSYIAGEVRHIAITSGILLVVLLLLALVMR